MAETDQCVLPPMGSVWRSKSGREWEVMRQYPLSGRVRMRPLDAYGSGGGVKAREVFIDGMAQRGWALVREETKR